MNTSVSEKIDRLRGMLWGLIVGDCLGSPVQFMEMDSFPKKYPRAYGRTTIQIILYHKKRELSNGETKIYIKLRQKIVYNRQNKVESEKTRSIIKRLPPLARK